MVTVMHFLSASHPLPRGRQADLPPESITKTRKWHLQLQIPGLSHSKQGSPEETKADQAPPLTSQLSRTEPGQDEGRKANSMGVGTFLII